MGLVKAVTVLVTSAHAVVLLLDVYWAGLRLEVDVHWGHARWNIDVGGLGISVAVHRDDIHVVVGVDGGFDGAIAAITAAASSTTHSVSRSIGARTSAEDDCEHEELQHRKNS